MDYYYFAATLPLLNFPAIPQIELVEFESRCAEYLSKKDFAILQKCQLEPTSEKSGSFVTDKFLSWDINLRNALIHLRVANNDTEQYLRKEADFYSEIETIIQEVNSKTNPLEKELAIDSARAKKIAWLGANNEFNIEYFCAYKLQLMLIEKYRVLDPEIGEKNFLSLVEQILNSSQEKKGAK